MSDDETQKGGEHGGVHRMADLVIGLIRSRFELIATEFHEERYRLMELVLIAGICLALGLLALLLFTFTIIVLTWETAARDWVMIGFTLLYAGGFVFMGKMIQARLGEARAPFSATLEEFKKDRECFSRKS